MAAGSRHAGMLAVLFMFTFFATAHAQTPASEQQGLQQGQQLQDAVDAMRKVMLRGPSQVGLINQATLQVQAGTNFVPQPQAGDWAAASGYAPDEGLVGVVIPDAEQNWIIFIDYQALSRIADDEARNWDSDVLLANLRASTEQGNAAREKRGEPQLDVKDWLIKPFYDTQAHTLIWSANSVEKGEDATAGSANIHAYVLGRDGYFEMTMVAPSDEIASHADLARSLLAGLRFGTGRRYGDYLPSRDIPEKSITSLISPASPGLLAQFLAYWPAGVLLLLVAAGLILRNLRTRARQ